MSCALGKNWTKQLAIARLGMIGLAGISCVATVPPVVEHQHHLGGTIALEAANYRVRGYDPKDARLIRALNELENLLGRPIEIRFHTVMMPRTPGFFEHFFDNELGKLPHRLRAFKESQPKEFNAMLKDLRYIDFDYDGSLEAAQFEVGVPKERLHLMLNSWELSDKLMNGFLDSYRHRLLAVGNLNMQPEAVPVADRSDYVNELLRFGSSYFASIDGKDPANAEPEIGRSEVILRLLKLDALSREAQPKLKATILEALLSAGRYFRDCHQSYSKFVINVREPSRWLRAKHEWQHWSLGALETLDPEARYALVDILLVPDPNTRTLLNKAVFPDFDLTSFGFKLLEAWARAGHPSGGDNATDPTLRLFDRVLCPSSETDRGFRTLRARQCFPAFFAMSLMAPPARARLLSTAVETEDPVLFREILMNLLALTSSHLDFPKPPAISAVIDIWKQLETRPERFREMARLLAIEIEQSTDLREALYDQTTRYYRTRTADRGVLLFLLVRIDGYSRTSVNWKKFSETYGAPITDSQLSTYFDQSYLAFEKFHYMSDALPGSPGRVLAKKLNRFLDDPIVKQESRTSQVVLRAIVAVLRRRNDASDLAHFHAELKRYVASDPTRERTFRDILESFDSH